MLTLLAVYISAILKFGAGAPMIHHWSTELMGGVVFGRHRGSHTARSGQVPHPPGGTEVASVDPSGRSGDTIRGARGLLSGSCVW